MSIYYQDDTVTLHLGDCLEVTDWLEADVLVTDPPYGVAYQSHKPAHERGNFNEIANDRDTVFRDNMLHLWSTHSSNTGYDRPGGKPALVFGSWKMPKPHGTHTVLTWDKGMASGMGNLSVPWKPNTEEIYVLGAGFQGRRDSSVLTGHTVVTWASKGREHPNMKPLSLMSSLVSKTVGVIADPFAGSGTTLVAAKRLGRKAIGCEVDERYCEVIASRLDQGVLDLGELA